MTDFEGFEGGMAVAQAPEEEKPAVDGAPVDAEAQTIEVEAEPADAGFDMEWEVETVLPEEPEVETVTEETVVEEYYEPGYERRYGQGHGPGYGREYDQGYGRQYDPGYEDLGRGHESRRRVARRYNKHVFTWLLSFVLGIYGVDRFARGQIGLGMLKLLTFGGFGFWYLYDAAVAIIMSYAGPYRYNDEVTFDQFGQYYY